MTTRLSLGLVLLLLLVATAVAGQPVLQSAMPAAVRVAKAAPTAAGLALMVETPAGPLVLELERTTAFEVQARRAASMLRDGDTRVYRGAVRGEPGSWVRLTRVDGAWLGAIRTASDLWLLDPARDHAELAAMLGAGPDDSLVFTLGDVAGLEAVDDVALRVPQLPLAVPTAPEAQRLAPQAGPPWYLGVTLVLDTEFQSLYGANAAATAVGILNIVDGFYSAQVDTEVYLHALSMLPAGNAGITATDANTLLEQFSAYVGGGNVPFHGIAHLFTGRDLDGSTAGIAWIGTLCTPYYGTGVDQTTFGAAVMGVIVAHEVGHNHNAMHDGDGNSCPSSGFIMAPVSNPGISTFSSCSIDYFDAYRSSRNPLCLLDRPDLIFADGFD